VAVRSPRSFSNEASFQKFVLKELNKIGCFFHKEAGSIRGLPDIIGVANGHFVALELKKNKTEMRRRTGRIVLQKHWLQKFDHEKGYAQLTYPGDWNEKYIQLCNHCSVTPNQSSLLVG
jgi:hypothetical protein